MKYQFSVTQEQDGPMAVVVGAFLDCEHYVFLHRKMMDQYEILEQDGLKSRVRQRLKLFGFLRMNQVFTLEYFPPGHFRSYDLVPVPWWIPSIHHFVHSVVDVYYTPHPTRDTTMMKFEVAMDIPFWLWPLRGVLRRMMEVMHFVKDQEDLDAIKAREKIYGRGNISYYLAEHQLMLNKDEYIKHFGPNKVKAAA